MLKKVILWVVMAAPLLAWHRAEITLNNHDLDGRLDLDFGQFGDRVDPDTTLLGIRYLHGSYHHADAVLKNLKKDNALLDVHFRVQQRIRPLPELTVGMGVKFVHTTINAAGKDYQFNALPLGVNAEYELLIGQTLPIYFGASLYYSPEVLSFSDAKNYMDYEFNVDVMVIDRAGLTLGYRHLDTNFDFEAGDLIFNESWFVGVKFRF